MIIITHDPRTAAYADREIIIRDGRVSVGSRAAAA
jgi:putative ABC transport system ATP-binding protein